MKPIVRFAVGLAMALSAGSTFAAASGVSVVDAAWVKAMKAGDVDAAVKCYDADAVVWVTGASLAHGAQEIRAAYADFFNTLVVKDVATHEMGNETVGTQSVAWGTYRITTAPKSGGEATTVTGRYTEVARRIGKSWVYTIDHASDDPSPSADK